MTARKTAQAGWPGGSACGVAARGPARGRRCCRARGARGRDGQTGGGERGERDAVVVVVDVDQGYEHAHVRDEDVELDDQHRRVAAAAAAAAAAGYDCRRHAADDDDARSYSVQASAMAKVNASETANATLLHYQQGTQAPLRWILAIGTARAFSTLALH